MKPLKPFVFLILTSSLGLAFVGLLIWWITFMLASFHRLDSSHDPEPSPAFQKLNLEAYDRIFPPE